MIYINAPTIRITAAIAFSLITLSGHGQGPVGAFSKDRSNGIYFTMDDLKHNRIANQRITNAQNDLRIDFRNNLIVVREGNQTLLRYGTIAGYYKNGCRYRAYGKNKSTYGFYKVVDESGLIVYSRRVSNPKTGGHTWCYYSKTIDSQIRSLTAKNIRLDFHDNPGFIKAVFAAMKSSSLMDTNDGRTKINELYLHSLNLNN